MTTANFQASSIGELIMLRYKVGRLAQAETRPKLWSKSYQLTSLSFTKVSTKDWDPIGVSPHGPRDEYHRYLPQIFKLALEGAAPHKIAEYLHKVVTERMELASCVGDHLPIAKKIRTLKLELIPEK